MLTFDMVRNGRNSYELCVAIFLEEMPFLGDTFVQVISSSWDHKELEKTAEKKANWAHWLVKDNEAEIHLLDFLWILVAFLPNFRIAPISWINLVG